MLRDLNRRYKIVKVSMLYAVRPLDWTVFLVVAVLLLGVGFAALAIPAWNASRLSPSRALRWE
ncbi:MAG: hypothetical protein EHM23_15530 [Acidobacteria bacterium]|nr:MAG: hypothetical protein EHM23_15530 [Acidobacteriota bacterium]